MRPNIIQGNEETFNALVYPPPTQGLLNYLQTNMNEAFNKLGNTSSKFIDNAKHMYDRFNSSEAIQRAKRMLQKTGSHLNQDVIYPVSIENMNRANLTMQRYIMSHPEVSRMNDRNMCYGFQDTYLDLEPFIVGNERRDYNRVMDGMLQFDKEGNGYFNYYQDSYDEDDLDSYDKFSVLDTWENVSALIASGIDPTDPNMGRL